MPRFATTEQITKVNAMSGQLLAYQTIFSDLLKTIAGYIEAYELTYPPADQAGIATRYITSEGRDDERWRGHLLTESPGRKKVNVWCLTVLMNQGLPFDKDEAIGSFNKPYSIGIDYFYDWDFGNDTKNSEDFFNKKVDGFDFILEQIRTCLPNNADIDSWVFRRMIRQFTNASTHVAKGDLLLTFQGL
jgi:hypothetical protein